MCSRRFGGAIYSRCPTDLSWWSYDPALGKQSAIPFSGRPPGPCTYPELIVPVLCPIGTGFSEPNIIYEIYTQKRKVLLLVERARGGDER